jgi:predicted nuclease with TOPRIM domain
MTREARVAAAQATIFALLDNKQKEFIEFVLSKYVETGVEELDQEKLPILLTNKYQSLEDAKDILGDVANISRLFIEFQQHLYPVDRVLLSNLYKENKDLKILNVIETAWTNINSDQYFEIIVALKHIQSKNNFEYFWMMEYFWNTTND